jgi:nucleoside-diphosphate-sugar epimerase
MNAPIGIIGASGFVGASLCERLFFDGQHEFIPFIHTSGNAWRIARLPIRIRSLDLLDAQAVRHAVCSCGAIVNCALGSAQAMSRGLQNLVDAARQARLQKFVHFSSIAIYGQDPASDTVTERGMPNPGRNEYGRLKLRQDRIVQRLHDSGVPCYTLCPGNIAGPYSTFVAGLAERLVEGPLPLVDGGQYPSNLIHVDNLVEAVLACLRADRGPGQRYFVNETRPIPWRQVFDDLAALLGIKPSYCEVRREDVIPHLDPRESRLGLRGQLNVMLSREFRTALARLPAFGFINNAAYSTFARLPQHTQARVKERLQWPIRIPKSNTNGPALDDRYVRTQARRFYHSPERLLALGWRPPLTYERGLETTAAWLRFAGIPESVTSASVESISPR